MVNSVVKVICKIILTFGQRKALNAYKCQHGKSWWLDAKLLEECEIAWKHTEDMFFAASRRYEFVFPTDKK